MGSEEGEMRRETRVLSQDEDEDESEDRSREIGVKAVRSELVPRTGRGNKTRQVR